MKSVEWLWPGRIPLGKCSDLQGDPGEGKSVLTANIAALVSNGGLWPDGSQCEQGRVWMVSSEDDAADTIKPRLAAAGANMKMIIVRTLADELITLPEDLGWIQEQVIERQIRLIILDPLDAFVSEELDTNRNQSIRRLLAHLAKLADDANCAIVVVRHLNKDSRTTNPMYRGGGSIGMNAAARGVLLCGPSPTDRNLKVLACVKSNLMTMPPSLGYRLVGAPVTIQGTEQEIVKVQWEGEVEWSARDLLQEPEAKHIPTAAENEKLELAKELLTAIFADGNDHPAADVEEMIAQQAKLSHGLLVAARKELGIRARKKGFGGVWMWCAPRVNEESEDPEESEDFDSSMEGS